MIMPQDSAGAVVSSYPLGMSVQAGGALITMALLEEAPLT
jgi:hypothetical protein